MRFHASLRDSLWGLAPERRPVRCQDQRGQYETEQDVDRNANATSGFAPAVASSRKRVVKPMLRKQKMKAQVRRSLIGATKAGFTILLKSARPYPAVTAVTMTEVARNPSTNFGKRSRRRHSPAGNCQLKWKSAWAADSAAALPCRIHALRRQYAGKSLSLVFTGCRTTEIVTDWSHGVPHFIS